MNEKSFEDCGWAVPGKRLTAYCRKKKMTFDSGSKGLGICPCNRWIKRLRIDRLRGKS